MISSGLRFVSPVENGVPVSSRLSQGKPGQRIWLKRPGSCHLTGPSQWKHGTAPKYVNFDELAI